VREIAGLPNYKKTPVLFVTSVTDFEHRADVCRSGGNDLIAKPFLATELGLKALTLIVKSKTLANLASHDATRRNSHWTVYKSPDLCDKRSIKAMMLLTQRSRGKKVDNDQ